MRNRSGTARFFRARFGGEEDMSMYSVYIRCSFEPLDSTNPTHREVHSLEVPAELLSFVVALKDATLAESGWEIEEVLILPSGELCEKPADEHHDSLDNFLTHFRGVRFKVGK
ncbi:MAG: hypothetical protein COV91_02820 [Candidatus Taylorbacteria bacterium CG11_big_fil_rev_8_21_14_0_20_46_11]|uniref:Uncharacterized protein n=1 Tax=Candidatus Taylorbacteria bacterium CG11_big_fil_rev_8_21_14_0_20_46_11 TaxID=1975025 RepID=A0A2H0KBR1_9BACT|nr:MAG: hypothetical protein COV91_02820 [Candidatus Taylorbacteria bacterium CG11_big_fil_rev_8_21_14_0_20_46_11]